MISKKTRKILIKSAILSTLLLLSIFIYVNYANAADAEVGQTPLAEQFHFPWSEASDIAGLIKQIYLIALGLIGALALAMIIFGGIQYATSAGNPSRQTDARDRITQAIWGVVLLLCAYLIFNTINPDLIKLKEPEIETIIPEVTEPLGGLLSEQALAGIILNYDGYGWLTLDRWSTHCPNTGTSPYEIIQSVTKGITGGGGPARACSCYPCPTNGICDSCDCNELVDLSTNLLNALKKVADSNMPFTITSLTGGHHTCNSAHYQGRAADIVPHADPSEWPSYLSAFISAGADGERSFCDKDGRRMLDCKQADHIHIQTIF